MTTRPDRTTVTVKVTQAHIDEGTQGCCRTCPIAKAIAEVLKPGSKFRVHRDTVQFFDERCTEDMIYVGDGYIGCAKLDVNAVVFIRRFDSCNDDVIGAVKPFEFELHVPAHMARAD